MILPMAEKALSLGPGVLRNYLYDRGTLGTSKQPNTRRLTLEEGGIFRS